jgi:hypothetical protein
MRARECMQIPPARDEHRVEYHFTGLQNDLEGNFLPMISFQKLQI